MRKLFFYRVGASILFLLVLISMLILNIPQGKFIVFMVSIILVIALKFYEHIIMDEDEL